MIFKESFSWDCSYPLNHKFRIFSADDSDDLIAITSKECGGKQFAISEATVKFNYL